MSAHLQMLYQAGIIFSIGITLVLPKAVEGCSICASLAPTLCDEIGAADIAVMAVYDETPTVDPGVNDPDAYKSSFHIQKILKGVQEVSEGDALRVLFFPGETARSGDRYLIHGNWIENDDQTGMVIRWTTPIAMTERAIDYLHIMWELPKEDVQRLIVAMPYLENDDPMIRRDAFDEFGKSPYEMLEKLKPELDKNLLIDKIQDSNTEPNVKKLFYTLLTICGTRDELPFLQLQINKEKLNASDALPAIIACYLSLAGAEGLPFIENAYLMQKGSEYERRAGAAITALRFHGQEASVINREKIADVFLRMLETPTLGAQVLSDLARWENWSAVDRVANMFIDAEGDTLWVREPAIRYLLACPNEDAKAHIAKLEEIDALAVRNGRRFAFPRTIAKTTKIKDKSNLESPLSGARIGNRSERQDSSAKKRRTIDTNRQGQSSGRVDQQVNHWQYGLPLAAGAIFVILLGWLSIRRG